MPSAALTVVEMIEGTPKMPMERKAELVASVPAWQWAVVGGFWRDLAAHCSNRIVPPIARRPVNGLNVEIGAPDARCLFRPPIKHKSNLAWYLSGGSVLDYGRCEQCSCYRAKPQT